MVFIKVNIWQPRPAVSCQLNPPFPPPDTLPEHTHSAPSHLVTLSFSLVPLPSSVLNFGMPSDLVLGLPLSGLRASTPALCCSYRLRFPFQPGLSFELQIHLPSGTQCISNWHLIFVSPKPNPSLLRLRSPNNQLFLSGSNKKWLYWSLFRFTFLLLQ